MHIMIFNPQRFGVNLDLNFNIGFDCGMFDLGEEEMVEVEAEAIPGVRAGVRAMTHRASFAPSSKVKLCHSLPCPYLNLRTSK
jgi:hypothetical protein